MEVTVELNCTDCDWSRAVDVDARMHLSEYRAVGLVEVLDHATQRTVLRYGEHGTVGYVACERTWGLEGGGNAGHPCPGRWSIAQVVSAVNAQACQ